jgi:hypothetical protein
MAVAHVVGQVQLDGAERLHHVGDGGVEAGVALAPGDVVAQRPAPLALGALEELAVQLVEGRFEVRGDYWSVSSHEAVPSRAGG